MQHCVVFMKENVKYDVYNIRVWCIIIVYFSADSVVHFLKTSTMYGLVEITNWLACAY